MTKKVRALFSTMRSGSTLVMHCLAQHPNISCISGTIKKSPELKSENISWEGVLSWKHEKDFLFVKNTYDKNIYYPFYNTKVIPLLRPLFLFREPVQTINSIILKEFMNSSVEDAIKAYKKGAYGSYVKAKKISPENIRCITYETLSSQPEKVLKKLLRFWEIPWNPAVVDWPDTFSEKTFSNDITLHQEHIKKAIQENHHDTLVKSTKIIPTHNRNIILSKEDVDLIEKELRGIYNQIKDEEFINEK